jgi:uncharacterized membrane protein
MEVLKVFLGRFHPLFVHFPIGLLAVAFIFEVLALRESFQKLRYAVHFVLVIGAASAIASAITGYLLSLEGGYPDELLQFHQNLGIATAAFATVMCFARKMIYRSHPEKQARVNTMLLFVLVILLSMAGHAGGSLTHGEAYLTEALSMKPPGAEGKVMLNVREDMDSSVLYADVIKPVLDAKCYSCHSAAKQKGQLRLDGIDFIKQGGKHGEVLRSDIPDSSSLYHRLVIPVDDEKHMPPREKTQLTSAEVDLIHLWIEEGYSFDKPIGQYKEPGKLKTLVAAIQAESIGKESWVPKEPVAAADAKSMEALRKHGVLITPVAADNHYLMLNFINTRERTDSLSLLLIPIKDNIVWLNMANAGASDESMKVIHQLYNIRYLYLQNTRITDKGMTEISKLENLQLLNVVGTDVTDQSVQAVSKLKNLKEFYAFRTKVSAKGFAALKAVNAKVTLDTGGYQLPFLPSDTIVYK